VAGGKPAPGRAEKRIPKHVSADMVPEPIPPASERRYVDIDPWAVLLEQFIEVSEEEPAERKGGKRK
jgi:hypothetical protein